MEGPSIFTVLVIAAFLGIITGKIARSKGHSFWVWWFFGWMLFIVALPCSLFLKRNEEVLSEKNGTKQCPYCAEWVKKEAIVCKHCGRDLKEVA